MLDPINEDSVLTLQVDDVGWNSLEVTLLQSERKERGPMAKSPLQLPLMLYDPRCLWYS